jgi:hypothetical protein
MKQNEVITNKLLLFSFNGTIVNKVILYLGSAFIFFVRTTAMGGAAARVQGKGGLSLGHPASRQHNNGAGATRVAGAKARAACCLASSHRERRRLLRHQVGSGCGRGEALW